MLDDRMRTTLGVSRETEDRLTVYVETLLRWNQKINLIGRATAGDVWARHIADSAQLCACAPMAKSWVDLGSGAGLPALVIAAILGEKVPDFAMTAIESDQRKCAFMADVARKMGTPITIINDRIEKAPRANYDVISARALAPLTKLLSYAALYRSSDTTCLFPKGAKADQELTEAARDWHMSYEHIPSVTDTASVILKIKAFERVA